MVTLNMLVLAPRLKSVRPPDSAPLRTHTVPKSAVTDAEEDINGSTLVVSQCSDAGKPAGSAPEPPIQERPPPTPLGPTQAARNGRKCRA